MPNWKNIKGHIGTPQGFRGSALHAGIKKKKGELDLALIYCEAAQAAAAGVFTTNRAAAAPVVLSRQNLRFSRGRARAVVVNAGNANACTGRAGIQAAGVVAGSVAALLRVPPREVLVASTGVIGVPLQPGLITRKLPLLAASLTTANSEAVARAILTTDTFPKTCVLRTALGGKTVTLAGIAKGAGMIHPRMATMLSFITTDMAVEPGDLQEMLSAAVSGSFNRISVDGDTSTNDTVILMASGLSGVQARPGSRAAARFLGGLTELCQTLAKMIVRDGEGAKKLVTLEVRGARTDGDADRIARAIANSPLVKTAIAGSDPNWGRILCAAGYSGAKFDPGRVKIQVNDLVLCRHGQDAGFDEAAAKKEFDRPDICIRLDLGQGTGCARMWTCDLTHGYITINASYRT
ncbi:MAG: bifunctional glutamate N-acetyltransferase/amino-acid acetyltransferase ArgJ [Terriglobia bacterium]